MLNTSKNGFNEILIYQFLSVVVCVLFKYQIWEVLLGHPLQYGCLRNVYYIFTPFNYPRHQSFQEPGNNTHEQASLLSKTYLITSVSFKILSDVILSQNRNGVFGSLKSGREDFWLLYTQSCQSDRRDTLWRHRTSADWSCDATDSENAIKWDYDT